MQAAHWITLRRLSTAWCRLGSARLFRFSIKTTWSLVATWSFSWTLSVEDLMPAEAILKDDMETKDAPI